MNRSITSVGILAIVLGPLSAVFAHGLVCVGAKVHDDLMDLRGIRKDFAGFSVDLLPDFNVFGQCSAQQFYHFFHNQMEI
jgi:hypothetical protein